MTQPTAPTADQYDEAQEREWTTYVARSPIDFYGVRAYNTGDPVPASAVDNAGGWVPEGLVRVVNPQHPAYEGSATVVDPAPPTIDESTVAAPAASSPAPPPAEPAPAEPAPADTTTPKG